MKGELVRTVTSDKLELAGLLYEPAGDTRGVAVLQLHGATSNFYRNHTWGALAERLPPAGVAFLTANMRGHDIVTWVKTRGAARSALLGNAYESFPDSVKDIAAWLDLLGERGWTRVVLSGHSYGAMKSAYYQSQQHDPRVIGLSLLSPADRGFMEAMPGRDKAVAQAQQLVDRGEPLQLVFFEGNILGAQRLLDPRNATAVNIFNYADPAHPWTEVAGLRVPVLLLFGTEQEILSVPPREALEIARQKATSCPSFTGAVVDGAPHNYEGFEDRVADIVAGWVNSII